MKIGKKKIKMIDLPPKKIRPNVELKHFKKNRLCKVK
uniref:Uncharacterized protein n=1 Tax=Romanomermis culicivorax TaxID=13658 RepID=A0A915KQY2_ROMCU